MRARGGGYFEENGIFGTQQAWYIYGLTETVVASREPAQAQARWGSSTQSRSGRRNPNHAIYAHWQRGNQFSPMESYRHSLGISLFFLSY